MAKNPFLNPTAGRNPFFDAEPSRVPSIDFDPFAPTQPVNPTPTNPPTLTAQPCEPQTNKSKTNPDSGVQPSDASPVRPAQHGQTHVDTGGGNSAFPDIEAPATVPQGKQLEQLPELKAKPVQPFAQPDPAPRVNPFDFCDLLQIVRRARVCVCV
jgi:hypothetical protein